MSDAKADEVGLDSEEVLSRQLVVRMARGDRAALAELYQMHEHSLRSLALRMLKDAAEAGDLVHDVFLESWKSAASFDSARGTVRSWLLLRTRSRALDRLRAPARTRRAEVSPAEARVLEPVGLATQERDIDARRLPDALEHLSEVEREVLCLGYFEGLTCSEIAERLGIPMGTVKSRTRSALQRLREHYEETTS